jgi:hypothetical protein
MSRYLVDSGPPVTTVLDALWEHRCQSQWHPDWAAVPDDFLTTLHNAASPPS